MPARSARLAIRPSRSTIVAACLLAACGPQDADGAASAASSGSSQAASGVGGSASSATAGTTGASTGGASTSSGAAGAGAMGGAGGGAPIACPGPFVLCEDFENGIDPTIWTTSNGPTIDGTLAHRGTHSIHFVTDPAVSNPGGKLTTKNPFPELANEMWGRVFVYMVQTPPGSTTTLSGPNSSFAWEGGNGGDLRIGFRHTRLSAGWNYPGYDQTNTDDLVWPLHQWVCVEWHHKFDPVQGTVTQDYWMDGMPRPKMHFDAHPLAPATFFWIGMYLFGSKYDLWMDDVVVDVAQVGCSR